MTEEIWKVPYPYEEFEVSNLGHVKKNGRTLHPSAQPHCYISVYIDPKKYGQRTIALHKLIAIAFLPNPKNLQQVDHLDNNKHNNRVSNLMWCDQSTNIKNNWKHRKKQGTKAHRRIIECVETGDRFNSYDAAAKFADRHPKRIYDVYIGVQKTAGGYHWKFIEE